MPAVSTGVTGARFLFVRLWSDLPTRRAAESRVAVSMLPTGPLVVVRLEASRDGAPRRLVVRGARKARSPWRGRPIGLMGLLAGSAPQGRKLDNLDVAP